MGRGGAWLSFHVPAARAPSDAIRGAEGGGIPPNLIGATPAWPSTISLIGCVLRGLWVGSGHRRPARAGQGAGAGAELGPHPVPPCGSAPSRSRAAGRRQAPRRPGPSSPTQEGPSGRGRAAGLLWRHAAPASAGLPRVGAHPRPPSTVKRPPYSSVRTEPTCARLGPACGPHGPGFPHSPRAVPDAPPDERSLPTLALCGSQAGPGSRTSEQEQCPALCTVLPSQATPASSAGALGGGREEGRGRPRAGGGAGAQRREHPEGSEPTRSRARAWWHLQCGSVTSIY